MPKRGNAGEPAKTIERAGKALHDDIGPLLSAAGLQLQLIRMDFPETAEQVRVVTETLDRAIDRIRALSQELAPPDFSKHARNSSRKGTIT
jgi:signal transduction histidine kinase